MKEISLGEEAKDCPAFPYTEGQLGLSKVVVQIYNWQGKNEMLTIFFLIYIYFTILPVMTTDNTVLLNTNIMCSNAVTFLPEWSQFLCKNRWH